MSDLKLLKLAADKVVTLDDAELRAAHERSHSEELLKSRDGLSAHHILASEATSRGFACEASLPALLISALEVTKEAFEGASDTLPINLVASLRQAFDSDAPMAVVMTMLDASGFDVEVVARERGDIRTSEQIFADLISSDENDEAAAAEEEEEENEEDTGSGSGVLSRFLASLAELLGVEKSYSQPAEDSLINCNKRNSISRTAHKFEAAKFKARDGQRRCLSCGGSEPTFGETCNARQNSRLVVGKTASFAKADERRFTLGPMYIPDRVDAGGDWTDGEELQQALWDYVRTNDRRIRLQHNREVTAGEWVEVMTFPFAMSVPMIQADGSTTEVDYPADTVFMGIVWEPWAWRMVKEGKLRGLSIGGKALRVEADIPVEVDKSDPSVSSVHINMPISAYPKKIKVTIPTKEVE